VAPPEGAWTVVPHLTVVPQGAEDDCGRAALATALSRWGVSLSANDAALAPKGGITAGALRDEARRHGFSSFVFQGGFDDLALELQEGRPVVVGLVRLVGEQRTTHFAVVVGRDVRTGRWLMADPAVGVQPLSGDALRDEWARSGWVTLVLFPIGDSTATPPA
jgi:predicted double-glycine peptidase